MTTNAITTAYLAEVSRQGMHANELLDAAKRSFDVSATSYFGRMMTRPVFLDHAEFAALRHDISFLHSVLTDLPRRLFGGDIAAFGRAVGTPAPSRTGPAAGGGRLDRVLPQHRVAADLRCDLPQLVRHGCGCLPSRAAQLPRWSGLAGRPARRHRVPGVHDRRPAPSGRARAHQPGARRGRAR